MKSYILKPNSIRKSEIVNRFHSLLPSEHRIVEVKNLNQKSISDLIENENVGEQIDVKEYLNFDSKYYLGTISGMNGLLYNEVKCEAISPFIFKNSTKKLNEGDFIISRNASLGKISYVDKNINAILNGGLSYLRFKKRNKWYFFAFFVINYGSEYLTCITSGGGTQQNAKRQNLLDLKIPFPTNKNNKNPQQVENLISLIAQNIISKEKQIEIKNNQINESIEKELKENQRENAFFYKFPRISDIKKELRFDTGLYEKDFQEYKFLIENYKYGFKLLNNFKIKYKSGATPKLFDMDDGDYPYFVRPTEISKNRTYSDLRKINFDCRIKKYRIDTEEGIILPRKGGINALYKPLNLNVLIGDSVKFGSFKNIDISFLSSFLTSKIIRFQLEKIKQKTNGGSLTEKNLNNLSIPNFSEHKQKEISKFYYNKFEKNNDLNFKNYLEKEKARNNKVGIFQLNMEIFSLKEILENLVDKIIKEQKIKISFNY